MKVLLDENLPYSSLVDLFPPFVDVYSVQWMEWRAKDNGELLAAAVQESFAVIITKDKTLERELKQGPLPLAIIQLMPDEDAGEKISQLISEHVVPLLERGVEKRVYRFGSKPPRGLDHS